MVRATRAAPVRPVAVAARDAAAKQAAAAPAEAGDGSSTGANAETLVIS